MENLCDTIKEITEKADYSVFNECCESDIYTKVGGLNVPFGNTPVWSVRFLVYNVIKKEIDDKPTPSNRRSN